ncbi:hypothetical protein C8R48DRAFT_769440 [Suillus tomentosus]|nr:hypothetical protein C8R48DRAFT_769440 [Suillus tomentosus]
MAAVNDHLLESDKGQIYQNIAKLLFAGHPKNLLDAALLELPWYTELDSIWHSNLSMATVTHFLKPGVDHTGAKTHASHGPHIPYHANALEIPHAGSSQFAPAHASTLTPAPAPLTLAPAPAPFTPAPTPASVPSHTDPYNTSLQFHLPSLLTPKDTLNDHNTDDDDFNQDISRPFDAPLGDYFKDDDMIVNEMTDSPAYVAGKKQQLPLSLSPPPNALEPFHRPAKSPTSSYNYCLAFGLQKPDVMKHVDDTKYHLDVRLLCVLNSPDITSNQHRQFEEEKVKSDVMEQADQMKDEIQSMHSDAMSHHNRKHLCFLMKLNMKSEHNCDVKKYKWIHTNHKHEASQATVSHQQLQETKDAEIRLHKTDIQVHEAYPLVLEKEAETL